MTDALLRPGSHRALGLVDDDALIAAIVAVEVAWSDVRAEAGLIPAEHAMAASAAAQTLSIDRQTLIADTELTGTPVLPVLTALRTHLGAAHPEATSTLHRGLTSQDVLDSALMVLSQAALRQVGADLDRIIAALASLADRHRATVMTGRSLTQPAVPITFGVKAARWLDSVIDAAEAVAEIAENLPVQCGGAVGTLALTTSTSRGCDPLALAEALASKLGLAWLGRPWQTRRGVLTRLGDALATLCDSCGAIATDVATLSRPEIGELSEGFVDGRGGSSTMPHKRNPVLSVLIRSAAVRAPGLAAQLHLAAALWVDERPDGAWHAQWMPWRELVQTAAIAASQTADLVSGLDVDVDQMLAHATARQADLLAEGPATELNDYLGVSEAIVDHVVARAAAHPSVPGGARG